MTIEEINALSIRLLKIAEQLESLLEQVKSSREEVNVLLTEYRKQYENQLGRKLN
jgi:hypothetical protein